MTGFKCGVALFLASAQLPKLFGIHGSHGNFWENSGNFLKHLGETNPTSLTIGAAALAVLILGKIFLKNKPVALFVVVGGILASGWLGLEARGVKLLGEVPQGLPARPSCDSVGRLKHTAAGGCLFHAGRRGNGRHWPHLCSSTAGDSTPTRNFLRSRCPISPRDWAVVSRSAAGCRNHWLTGRARTPLSGALRRDPAVGDVSSHTC
jgi:hypothetical protein